MKKIFLVILIMVPIIFNNCVPHVKERSEKERMDSIKNDSIHKLMKRQTDSIWETTTTGKIHKLHPDWSLHDCFNLAMNTVWIGMTLDQLKYLRGNPNHTNISNYGNGNEYQWCWDDLTPSCFYGKSDFIITSYN